MTIQEKYVQNTTKKDQKIAWNKAYCAFYGHKKPYNDIYKAYKKPSVKKITAWNYCRRLCEELKGFDICIPAAGNHTFSVAFKFNDDKTGQLGYAYITRDYKRFCWADTKSMF